MREENTLDYLAHGCSIPTRRSFELKREERRETLREEVLGGDALFDVNPLENGERGRESISSSEAISSRDGRRVRSRHRRSVRRERQLERENTREQTQSGRVVRW